MVDAGGVSNDEGGSVMRLGFLQSRDKVLLVGAHGNLDNLDVLLLQPYFNQLLVSAQDVTPFLKAAMILHRCLKAG